MSQHPFIISAKYTFSDNYVLENDPWATGRSFTSRQVDRAVITKPYYNKLARPLFIADVFDRAVGNRKDSPEYLVADDATCQLTALRLRDGSWDIIRIDRDTFSNSEGGFNNKVTAFTLLETGLQKRDAGRYLQDYAAGKKTAVSTIAAPVPR